MKDISNDLREGIVYAHQSVRIYKASSKQSRVHHFTASYSKHRLIIWTYFATTGPVYPVLDLSSPDLWSPCSH